MHIGVTGNEAARHGAPRAGRWLVQLRLETGLTSESYVRRQAWREASLSHCPAHPRGGCSFARHGTYPRKDPPGALIARWYCPQAHQTFSLLPDCLAARLPGSLERLEAVVITAEAAPSLAKAADALRADPVELPGAIRWTRRRVRQVHTTLIILIGLLPEHFLGCAPTLGEFRSRLGCECALVQLRTVAADLLHCLPPPLGFRPRPRQGGAGGQTVQHPKGPDPPPKAG